MVSRFHTRFYHVCVSQCVCMCVSMFVIWFELSVGSVVVGGVSVVWLNNE